MPGFDRIKQKCMVQCNADFTGATLRVFAASFAFEHRLTDTELAAMTTAEVAALLDGKPPKPTGVAETADPRGQSPQSVPPKPRLTWNSVIRHHFAEFHTAQLESNPQIEIGIVKDKFLPHFNRTVPGRSPRWRDKSKIDMGQLNAALRNRGNQQPNGDGDAL